MTGVTLVVRRRIAASPERLFRAWTDPQEFARWWGPRGVVCEGAEIDLRIGGAYRIANRTPDGALVMISGVFEAIEPPSRLVYSWRVERSGDAETRVVVTFAGVGDGTEVVVTHERNPSEAIAKGHEAGWLGCLDGLESYATRGVRPA